MRTGKLGIAFAVIVIATACGYARPAPYTSPTLAIATATPGTFGLCGDAGKTVPAPLFASDLSSRCQIFTSRVGAAAPVRTVHEVAGFRVTLKAGFGLPAEWAEMLVATQYASTPATDVRTELDVEFIAGSGTNEAGIACRGVGTPSRPGRWYDLLVGTDGSFLVEFWRANFSPTGPLANFDHRILASGAARIQSGVNQLRADCVGSTLDFYLNGSLLASVNDPDAPDGTSGIYMRNRDGNGAEFLFKNLVVRRL